jgi:hypothetical protein
MGYDIDIVNQEGTIIEANSNHGIKGSTFVLGGTTRLEFAMTCNYSDIMKLTPLGSASNLQDKKVADTIQDISDSVAFIVKEYPTEWAKNPNNYWVAHPYNVKVALESLMQLALLGIEVDPECKWSIS